ncbi:hypothetical protein RND71_037105 [Anisodus tanguticus]|uniref:Uncharacterized protein n=1 Tax=Anisodus tanguticus TaxID=243964 RepID=A0AAE1R2U1_9SOLA|nr:hypothetical protein RND71_037105 [Anisodus tanguticus]
MIGQAVTGVIEATLDAGYVLSVRIGDSNTNFRGIVFKPGHFDPVTAENDVAPNVQMIKRNDIHLPLETKFRYMAMTDCGAVVPVVLQPVNPTNGFPPSTQAPPDSSQAGHMTVAPLAMLPPNGSLTTSQVTQVGDQEALVTGQDGHGATLVQQKEVKPIVSNTCKPVEVKKGIQGSLSPNTNTKGYEASHKLSAGNLSYVPELDIGNMNELSPSDSINSPLPTQITPVSKPLMNYGIGRMTAFYRETLTAHTDVLVLLSFPWNDKSGAQEGQKMGKFWDSKTPCAVMKKLSKMLTCSDRHSQPTILKRHSSFHLEQDLDDPGYKIAKSETLLIIIDFTV